MDKKTSQFVTYREMAERLGVHRTTVVRWANNGALPRPIYLTNSKPVFVRHEVDTWLDRRFQIRNSDDKRACSSPNKAADQ